MTATRICVAQIGAAHGVRGEVRLWTFTADPLAVRDYGPLESEDGSRRFEIEALRSASDHLVVRFKGVADRNAAEALKNRRLFVPRDRLPAPEDDDTFYHADLIGLAAVDRAGAKLGTVLAIHNFGAGDILELQPAQGGPSEMLPFNAAVVPEIDVAAGRLVIVPPVEVMGEDRAAPRGDAVG